MIGLSTLTIYLLLSFILCLDYNFPCIRSSVQDCYRITLFKLSLLLSSLNLIHIILNLPANFTKTHATYNMQLRSKVLYNIHRLTLKGVVEFRHRLSAWSRNRSFLHLLEGLLSTAVILLQISLHRLPL